MSFESFAHEHGLIINEIVYDRWTRVPTTDHPRKRNGAYIFDGSFGAVQNWAFHERPIVYKSKESNYNPNWKEKALKRDSEIAEKQRNAQLKAIHMLNKSTTTHHEYLKRKGFPLLKGYVLDGDLLIPMRIDDKLVGLQQIKPDGTKKFLFGQKSKGATLKIDNKGRNILCEGYATALSVQRAMKALKQRYTIHICFSASNMEHVGSLLDNPLVIADHDPVGIKCASKIAKNYWLGDFGMDFNDMEMRDGTGSVSQSLALLL